MPESSTKLDFFQEAPSKSRSTSQILHTPKRRMGSSSSQNFPSPVPTHPKFSQPSEHHKVETPPTHPKSFQSDDQLVTNLSSPVTNAKWKPHQLIPKFFPPNRRLVRSSPAQSGGLFPDFQQSHPKFFSLLSTTKVETPPTRPPPNHSPLVASPTTLRSNPPTKNPTRNARLPRNPAPIVAQIHMPVPSPTSLDNHQHPQKPQKPHQNPKKPILTNSPKTAPPTPNPSSVFPKNQFYHTKS